MRISKTMMVGLGMLSMVACGTEGSMDEQQAAPKIIKAQNPVAGQYIIKLREPQVGSLAMRQDSGEVARGMVGEGKLLYAYNSAVYGFAARLTDAEVQQLAARADVEYIEEDGVVSIDATQTGATWGLDRIDQAALPLSTTYNYTGTASTANAYIIDTGILLGHTQFGGRAVTGYDAVTAGGTASDCNGHGTHVAGTVGGSTYGVAKAAMLYAVRVLGCTGSGTNAGVIAGVDWVRLNHRKPAVANMSLGGAANSTLDTAINNLVNAGVTVVVAAGNSNVDASGSSPARVAAAITVGATTNTDARASYSNFGSILDIFAPGSSITSAWYTSTTAINTISGTSMASPHVAGCAARYLAANPTATPAAVANFLIANATLNRVTSPGTGSPNRLLYCPPTL